MSDHLKHLMSGRLANGSWKKPNEEGTMSREIPQSCGQCECCAAWRTVYEADRARCIAVVEKAREQFTKGSDLSTIYAQYSVRDGFDEVLAALRAEPEADCGRSNC